MFSIEFKRILIALYVGSEDDGSTLISHGSKQGNLWSLAIDIENKNAYYGDSLAWPILHNLIISELEDNLFVKGQCSISSDLLGHRMMLL